MAQITYPVKCPIACKEAKLMATMLMIMWKLCDRSQLMNRDR